MARTRKEPLSDEEKKIADEYNKKILKVKKEKAEALKKANEQKRIQQYNMALGIMMKLQDIYGNINGDICESFVEYMEKNRSEIKEKIALVMVKGDESKE